MRALRSGGCRTEPGCYINGRPFGPWKTGQAGLEAVAYPANHRNRAAFGKAALMQTTPSLPAAIPTQAPHRANLLQRVSTYLYLHPFTLLLGLLGLPLLYMLVIYMGSLI